MASNALGTPKSTLVALLALLALAALSVVPSAPTAVAQSTVGVTINNFAFSPNNITVVIGVNNTVTWTMEQSGVPYHTVTPNPGDPVVSWGSGQLTTGQTYSFTFTVPGTYGYHCSLHTYMIGTVVVLAGSSSASSTPSSTSSATTSSQTSSGSVPEFPLVAVGVTVFVVVFLAAYLIVRPRNVSIARVQTRLA